MTLCKDCRRRAIQANCSGRCWRCQRASGRPFRFGPLSVAETTARRLAAERAEVAAVERREREEAQQRRALARARAANLRSPLSTIGQPREADGIVYVVAWDGTLDFEEAGA